MGRTRFRVVRSELTFPIGIRSDKLDKFPTIWVVLCSRISARILIGIRAVPTDSARKTWGTDKTSSSVLNSLQYVRWKGCSSLDQNRTYCEISARVLSTLRRSPSLRLRRNYASHLLALCALLSGQNTMAFCTTAVASMSLTRPNSVAVVSLSAMTPK